MQDDYPAFWVRYKTRKHYLAWVAYQNAKDRVLLATRDGPDGKWSEPIEVSGPGQHFRVALAGTHNDTLWIVYARQEHTQGPKVTGRWDLHGRPFKDGKLGKEVRLTEGTTPNLWHRMTTDHRGRAWLVWQGFDLGDGQRTSIAQAPTATAGTHRFRSAPARPTTGTRASPRTRRRIASGWAGTPMRPAITVSACAACPAARSRSSATCSSPRARPGSSSSTPTSPWPATATAAFGRHGTNPVHNGARTLAISTAAPNGPTPRVFMRRARVASPAHRWDAPPQERLAADFASILPPLMKEYNELPQLQADGEGRMWLAWRHRTCRHPRQDGWASQGRWDSYATAFVGDRWLTPIALPASDGRIDMRLDSQRDREGGVYFAYASDNRGWSPPGMPPHNHHVTVSRLSGAAPAGAFQLTSHKLGFAKVRLVHPQEAEQVARIRNYKIEAGGKTYHIYRGDLHRHTDISGDGPGDGTVTDLHRYALDAAAMDYVLVGDHNMGQDNEYCWWRTQQFNDLYTVPGAFLSMYGYERSVQYPRGHRNVIWPERGHRTLPLPKPVPGALKDDTTKLYAYLRRTGGICTLHTSATDQGTDWEDAIDPSLEPFVEIFQGYHTSYEAPDAPKAITAKSDVIHGGFQAQGLRVAGAGEGIPPRLPGVERPHFHARQLRLRPGRGV